MRRDTIRYNGKEYDAKAIMQRYGLTGRIEGSVGSNAQSRMLVVGDVKQNEGDSCVFVGRVGQNNGNGCSFVRSPGQNNGNNCQSGEFWLKPFLVSAEEEIFVTRDADGNVTFMCDVNELRKRMQVAPQPPQQQAPLNSGWGSSGGSTATTALASAFRATQQKPPTIREFFMQKNLYHRNALLLALNHTGGWKKFLANMGYLRGEVVERDVAHEARVWEETHSNDPAWKFIEIILDTNEEFAKGSLDELAKRLAGCAVETEVGKMLSHYKTKEDEQTRANDAAYTAQNTLRAWLVNGICKETEADALVNALRREGFERVDQLQGLERQDLKNMGFNLQQAIEFMKKIQSK
jgi:hypothetical protein